MEGKEVFASLLAPQRSTKTLVYEDLIREVVMKSFDIQHSLVFLRQAFLTR